ncbi:unnamed protein product [Parajaminaea phylloscopi]
MVDHAPSIQLPPLSSVAIPERPASKSLLQTIVFSVYFMSCIVLCHSVQVVLQPFRLFPQTKFIATAVNQWAKGAFGKCLVNMTWLFSPGNVVLSFRDEHGNLLDPQEFVTLNSDGRLDTLNLPKRSIWISNHQVYTDWLYLWIICYFCGYQESVYIILKDSLKWVPFVGPAMQWFDFIFLARSWAKDQRTLAHHLSKIAVTSKRVARPLSLFIFPEGTLVSPLTRPQSKAYADKVGLQDCRNLLLPRSTGLLYCARALKKDIDDLVLIDATIGYPGVPSDGYGQSYYTLRSIYMQGIPPPSVHVSITIRKIKAGPSPINPEDAARDAGAMPVGQVEAGASHLDLNAGELERRAFDAWLLARWREKDALMDAFYRDGDFVSGKFVGNKADAGEYYRPDDQKASLLGGGGDQTKGVKTEVKKQYISVPIRPRRPFIEVMNNVGYGVPFLIFWGFWKVLHG